LPVGYTTFCSSLTDSRRNFLAGGADGHQLLSRGRLVLLRPRPIGPPGDALRGFLAGGADGHQLTVAVLELGLVIALGVLVVVTLGGQPLTVTEGRLVGVGGNTRHGGLDRVQGV
jgi:hypothetical protein